MAGANEVLQQMVQLLPLLGELAARVARLEDEVAELRAGGGASSSGDDDGPTERDDSFEVPGVGKIDLGAMLKGAGGDPKTLFERAAKWRASQTTTPPTTATAAPPAASPPADKAV